MLGVQTLLANLGALAKLTFENAMATKCATYVPRNTSTILLLLFMSLLLLFPAQLAGGAFIYSSTFWTSRCHDCLPFAPLIHVLHAYHVKGSALPLLIDFHRILLSHAVALSETREKGTDKYFFSIPPIPPPPSRLSSSQKVWCRVLFLVDFVSW